MEKFDTVYAIRNKETQQLRRTRYTYPDIYCSENSAWITANKVNKECPVGSKWEVIPFRLQEVLNGK